MKKTENFSRNNIYGGRLIPLFLMSMLIYCSIIKMRQEPLVFSVMGDVPRSVLEDTLLQKQIETHNRFSESEFMVHVGDIKSGKSSCDENTYMKVAGYLKKLHVPTFIVPGDNEWNDCLEPDEAWHFWEKYFMAFEKNWKNVFKVKRHKARRENFALISKGVLLVGINLVGGRIHDQAEWDQVLKCDADWIKIQFEKNRKRVRAAVVFAQANPNEKHELFMNQFREAARFFKKPVLFIHGDGHKWIYDDPWIEPNIVRVQVDQGGIAPPLQVTVTFDNRHIFEFGRNPFPE